MQQQQLLQELNDLQAVIDRWFQTTSHDITAAHQKFATQIRYLEDAVGMSAPNGSTPENSARREKPIPQGLDWESLATPSRRPGQRESDVRTPSMASPPVSHSINYEAILDDVIQPSYGGSFPLNASGGTARGTRPTPESVARRADQPHSNPGSPCHVLVEFKRKRILQFESSFYVAPGEYVVVGGDRGEDIGLVTYSWPRGQKLQEPPVQSRNAAIGLGQVLRVANVLEVSQLQGVQTELEARAVGVAQEKVLEHQLPMVIVDAEYQFDRKKLTFFYQSQHRLDFRTLVRDLYKTFRARIWMEQDQS
jgi:hypothetical protein